MNAKCLFVVVVASGCSPSVTESKNDLEGAAAHVSDCCKLEGSEIGREDVLVRLGSKTVLVNEWVPKSDSPGEFVGFTITLGGGDAIHYVVKAAGEKYPSSALEWMHPNGPDGGSASPGVSNVDFCGECDNPDGCEGGGGGGGGDGGGGGGDGGDGGCDNPDGCDTGGGGSGPLL